MRRLTARFRHRVTYASRLAVALLAIVASVILAERPVLSADQAPTVHITSPLGRTGTVATVRIVAQVDGQKPASVRFFVDGALVGTVTDGPPYAVDWIDDNPFESREIVAEAIDTAGKSTRDTVKLPAFEITDQTDIASIVLEAAVYDRTGRQVSTLDASSFLVREDGVDQKIDTFSKETLPSTTLLMVDNSQSMQHRIDAVRRTTERFAGTLKRGDRVIVAPFNAHIGTITGPTDDVRTIGEAIKAMRAGGGTAFVDAIADGVKLLEKVDGRRALVLITDGYDENSVLEVNDVITAAESAHVTIYTVAVGGVAGVSSQGERTLRTFADRTGGRAFFPYRDAEVLIAANDVAHDTQSRYTLFYTPQNQTKDGTWRRISVQVPDGYTVRTRDGYRAPTPPPIRPTIEFTARTSTFDYVNLALDRIRVFEDGIAQKVDTFQEAVDPVSIVLTLDSSGSMRPVTDTVKQTAREFVSAVRPEDSLALITFSDAPLFAHLLGTTRQWTLDAIDKYTPTGGTALYDALWNSLQHVKTAKGRRAVVVLTDGRDEDAKGTSAGSAHTLADVLGLIPDVGATIYVVGLGKNVDHDVLARLATQSGGDAYFPEEASQLAEQFHSIVENLRRRYVVSYTSTNSARNGAWRKVDIKTTASDIRISSLGGYRAPSQ
jgi:Ca-activated chloride channel family protein